MKKQAAAKKPATKKVAAKKKLKNQTQQSDTWQISWKEGAENGGVTKVNHPWFDEPGKKPKTFREICKEIQEKNICLKYVDGLLRGLDGDLALAQQELNEAEHQYALAEARHDFITTERDELLSDIEKLNKELTERSN